MVIIDAAGNEAWAYDKLGHVLTDQRKTNDVTKTVTYTYNLDGSMATLAYPSGRTITYSPNVAGQAITAVDTANSINYVVGPTTCPNSQSASGVCYSPAGSMTSLKNGSSLTSTYYYNDGLQLCRMAVNSTGTPPNACNDNTNIGNRLDLSYDFDLGTANNGNVKKITDNRTSMSNRSANYRYDGLNRISEAYTDATSGSQCWGETFTVDPWGNLKTIGEKSTHTGSGCTRENFSFVATDSNRLDTGTSPNFSYDAAGNMIGDGTISPQYDAEGHIIGVAGVTYTYDGDGKRVKKDQASGSTYDRLYWYGTGADTLLETDLSGNLTNEYVFFGGKRTARRDSSANVVYYFSDHLGTARVVTDASGTVLDDCDYFPFGGVSPNCSTSSGNRYRFTGKERDPESGATADKGLDYFGARYHSSQYGRFTSPDPGPYLWADPQSFNRYTYTRSNPLKYIDPSGARFVISHADPHFKDFRAALVDMLMTRRGAEVARRIHRDPRPAYFSSGKVAQPRGTIRSALATAITSVPDPTKPAAIVGVSVVIDFGRLKQLRKRLPTVDLRGRNTFIHETFHVDRYFSASDAPEGYAWGEFDDEKLVGWPAQTFANEIASEADSNQESAGANSIMGPDNFAPMNALLDWFSAQWAAMQAANQMLWPKD